MKLLLTNDEGTVLCSWSLSRELPLDEQEPDAFVAVLPWCYGASRESVQAGLDAYSRRSDAEQEGL